MDRLPTFGRDVFAAMAPTHQIFGDLLRRPERLVLLNNTKRDQHRYGNHSRQTLDLYHPSSQKTGQPIFIFLHGGGFVSGGSIVSEIEGEVVYKGLGYFVSQELGYDTVIMNYRLLQHGAAFNSGGEDLDLVISWIEKNLCEESDKSRDMVIMGNSAGGVHAASWLFDEAYKNTVQRVLSPSANLRLRKVVILSATMLLDPCIAAMRPSLLSYYGTEEKVVSMSPLNLMRRALADRPDNSGHNSTGKFWPPLLLIATEYDPTFVIETEKNLLREWKEHGGRGEYWELPGHNHLSPPLALGTGDKIAEAWGFQLGERLATMS